MKNRFASYKATCLGIVQILKYYNLTFSCAFAADSSVTTKTKKRLEFGQL